MAYNAKEIIQMRNEAAVAYDHMIEEHGLPAARKILANRVGQKYNIVIPQKEVNASVQAIREAVLNVELAMVYSTLHHSFGWGEKRLKQFKEAFDSDMILCWDTDGHGRRYATIAEHAEEINRLYDMGLNVGLIWDTETSADVLADRGVSVLQMMSFLKKQGFEKAAQAIWTESYGKDCETNRMRTKEQRALIKKRRKADKKYRRPNPNLFDPDVSKGYLSIVAWAMMSIGIDTEKVMETCQTVNQCLGDILDYGDAILEQIAQDLEEKCDIVFDDKGGTEDE